MPVQRVVAVAAVQRIVAGIAVQCVVAGVALQIVVAVAAVQIVVLEHANGPVRQGFGLDAGRQFEPVNARLEVVDVFVAFVHVACVEDEHVRAIAAV